jgi:NADPH-dependent curcumin reductase CurA
MARKNHRFTLAARPVGMVKSSDFAFEEEELRELGRRRAAGEEPLHLARSGDARLDERGQVVHPPVGIGEVMRAGAIGSVVESKHPRFAVGSHVLGTFGMQEYAISTARASCRSTRSSRRCR